jgi:hypothetical protein
MVTYRRGTSVLRSLKLLALPITDLISVVVELLERDISRLVVEARETLELVEL